jgi:hypothetical protein
MRDASQGHPQLGDPLARRSAPRRGCAPCLALVALLLGLLQPVAARGDLVPVPFAAGGADDDGSIPDPRRLYLDDLFFDGQSASLAPRVSITCRTAPFSAYGNGLRDGGGVQVVAPAGHAAVGVPAPTAEAGRPEDERLPRPPDLDTQHRPPGGAAQ